MLSPENLRDSSPFPERKIRSVNKILCRAFNVIIVKSTAMDHFHEDRPVDNYRSSWRVWFISFQMREISHSKTVEMWYEKRLHVSYQAATTTLNKALNLSFDQAWTPKYRISLANDSYVCNTFMNKQQKEPMLSDDIPARPWQKVGYDIFQLHNKQYFIIFGTSWLLLNFF